MTCISYNNNYYYAHGINEMVTISTGIIPACSTCVPTCIHDNSFSVSVPVPGWVIPLLVISVFLWVISLVEGVNCQHTTSYCSGT